MRASLPPCRLNQGAFPTADIEQAQWLATRIGQVGDWPLIGHLSDERGGRATIPNRKDAPLVPSANSDRFHFQLGSKLAQVGRNSSRHQSFRHGCNSLRRPSRSSPRSAADQDRRCGNRRIATSTKFRARRKRLCRTNLREEEYGGRICIKGSGQVVRPFAGHGWIERWIDFTRAACRRRQGSRIRRSDRFEDRGSRDQSAHRANPTSGLRAAGLWSRRESEHGKAWQGSQRQSRTLEHPSRPPSRRQLRPRHPLAHPTKSRRPGQPKRRCRLRRPLWNGDAQ